MDKTSIFVKNDKERWLPHRKIMSHDKTEYQSFIGVAEEPNLGEMHMQREEREKERWWDGEREQNRERGRGLCPVF